MALKKTVSTVFGIDVIDAYHRVENVEIQGKNAIAYRVRSYKDGSGLPFFEDRFITSEYDINGDNPISQAYSHVKKLPEFADAVYC